MSIPISYEVVGCPILFPTTATHGSTTVRYMFFVEHLFHVRVANDGWYHYYHQELSLMYSTELVLFRFGSHPADSGSVRRMIKLRNTSPCGKSLIHTKMKHICKTV